MVTDALLTTRDGLTGAWQNPGALPGDLPVDDPHNMRLWSAEVRAHLLHQEATAPLLILADTSGTVRVQYVQLPSVSAGGTASLQVHNLFSAKQPPIADLEKQLQKVHDYADLRPDRAAEILAQLGMPTPFLGSVVFLRPDRSRFTLEFLSIAFNMVHQVHMAVKHKLAVRRPIDLSPAIQPIIVTPGHGSLPSGHATEAFALAYVLLAIIRAKGDSRYVDEAYARMLMSLAGRIAVNRQVAGVHYPIDSAVGAALGFVLGNYLVARASSNGETAQDNLALDNKVTAVDFDVHAFGGDGDFFWDDVVNLRPEQPTPTIGNPEYGFMATKDVALPSDDQCDGLRWLWKKAIEEWA